MPTDGRLKKKVVVNIFSLKIFEKIIKFHVKKILQARVFDRFW
jgi:hypothetical protein